MGNREDLLSAAARCLFEKGYARTTARDIAESAGVSLAAIGYHFGSKEALLNAALMQAIEEWSDDLKQALAAEPESEGEPMARFEATWTRVIDSFTTHRPMWLTSFELFAQIDHIPEIRTQLASVLNEARLGLAELFQGIDSTVTTEQALKVGAFYHALLSGVLVQWLIDPEHAPSAPDLADALRTIVADIGPTDEHHAVGSYTIDSSAERQD
jgi:AcrR family transcriptional regulator